mgnify:CR=1 FL=1
MQQKPKSGRGLITAILCRFLGSAVFGGFISLLLLNVYTHIAFDISLNHWKHWLTALWLIPIFWGILGIFTFDRMLDTARDRDGFVDIDLQRDLAAAAEAFVRGDDDLGTTVRDAAGQRIG